MKRPSAIPILVVSALLSALSGALAEEASRYETQDGWRMLGRALPFALKKNALAIHDSFMASYLRASSPFLGGEDLLAIHDGLSELLFLRGDKVFARALAVERPEVIAAVKLHIGATPSFLDRDKKDYSRKWFQIADFPRTKKLLDEAPEIDFPLHEDSPRRAALLKLLEP